MATTTVSTSPHVYPVIMAGGGGTRFWPVSRTRRPKQLLQLFGEETLLEQTVNRMLALAPPERTLVVTTESIAEEVRRLLPRLPAANVLLEPVGRNTAAAIAFSAAMALARDPKAIVAVVPSDHFIGDPETFARIAAAAVRYASAGHIVTLGIPPTRPETAYGYLKFGDFVPLDESVAVEPAARSIAAFVEKPNAETALRYLREGRFLWNSGMFFMRADRILAEVQRLLPELYRGIQMIADRIGTDQFDPTVAEVYPTLQSVSIDYGIMEHTEDILVIPAHIGWSDVGSWNVLDDLRDQDRENSEYGDVVALDAQGNVLYADAGCVVAVLGVSDLVVATSAGRVLVCPKERAQDVRRVVDELNRRGWTRFS